MKSPALFVAPFILFSIASANSGLDSKRPIIAETRHELIKLREHSRTWAPLCPQGYMSHGECPFGDMTIFAGISCLAGEKERCDDVKNSQGPDGRWWRSPGNVGIEDKNSFSRDQSLGVLSYLVKTKDKEAAKRWMSFILSNHSRTCKEASDNRCSFTPNFWGLVGDVWDYLGLKKNGRMKFGQSIDGPVLTIQAAVSPKGFPMHLTGVDAYILEELAKRGHGRVNGWQKSAKRKLVRRQPLNPFFRYLRDGATEEVARLTLGFCPKSRPNVALDWAWQREMEGSPYEYASGHDCVFMVNLLLGSDH